MFFRIPIDLYRTSLFFSSNQNHAELLCSLKKFHQPIQKDLDPFPDDAAARTFHFKDGVNLVEIKKANLDSFDFFENLAHELTHVTFDILNKRGFSLSPESEEAYTYLMGHLTGAVMRKINSLNVPKK